METLSAILVQLWWETTGLQWIPLTNASDKTGNDVIFVVDLEKQLNKLSSNCWFKPS